MVLTEHYEVGPLPRLQRPQLKILPREELAARGTIDRTASIPQPPTEPLSYPAVDDPTRNNGLRLLMVEENPLALLRLTLAFRAGSETDGPESAGRARTAIET